jgi:hypothetical protein
MPNVRKLEPQEVRTIENKGKGTRKITEEEYDRFLADFSLGDYGELIPDEGEKRITLRARLKSAAKRKGIPITFLRTRGQEIRFHVAEPTGSNQPNQQRVRSQAPLQEAAPTRRSRTTQVRDEVVREPFEDETPPVVPSLNAQPAKRKGGRPKKNG